MNVKSVLAHSSRRHARGRPARSLLDRALYQHLSAALLAAVAAGAIYFAIDGSWHRVAALGTLVSLGAGFFAAKHRLPSAFTLLFAFAALINLSGYLFELWTSPLWFDELAHAATSFTLMAGIGWALLARTRLRTQAKAGRLLVSVIMIGLVLGLAWERFEALVGIIGGPADTVVDLLMSATGAVAAGIFCAFAARRERYERVRGDALRNLYR